MHDSRNTWRNGVAIEERALGFLHFLSFGMGYQTNDDSNGFISG
jgi:hypothetical protein